LNRARFVAGVVKTDSLFAALSRPLTRPGVVRVAAAAAAFSSAVRVSVISRCSSASETPN